MYQTKILFESENGSNQEYGTCEFDAVPRIGERVILERAEDQYPLMYDVVMVLHVANTEGISPCLTNPQHLVEKLR